MLPRRRIACTREYICLHRGDTPHHDWRAIQKNAKGKRAQAPAARLLPVLRVRVAFSASPSALTPCTITQRQHGTVRAFAYDDVSGVLIVTGDGGRSAVRHSSSSSSSAAAGAPAAPSSFRGVPVCPAADALEAEGVTVSVWALQGQQLILKHTLGHATQASPTALHSPASTSSGACPHSVDG